MHVLQDMRGDYLTRYLSELRRRISAPTSAPSGSTHQVSSLDRTGSEERRLSESGVSMTYVGGKSAEVFFPPTTTTVAVRFVAPSRSLPLATLADAHTRMFSSRASEKPVVAIYWSPRSCPRYRCASGRT